MVEIKKIGIEDLSALTGLYEELTGGKTNFDKMRINFEWIDKNPDYVLIGAKDKDGNLIGSLLGIVCCDIVGECRPFMVIENVIVRSNFRGYGIGKKLMGYIEDYAQKRDCNYIFFVSSSQRKDAHKFYGSVGYSSDSVMGFKKYL